jgi:hypothetical protein
LEWSTFFSAHYDRAQYLRDSVIGDFAFDYRLWVSVAAGLGFCLVSTFLQAPFFRAIVGNRYPRSPRSLREFLRLFLFYVLFYLVVEVGLLAVPSTLGIDLLAEVVLLAILVVLFFADYVVVFEDVGPIRAIRRSLRLVRLRPVPVLVIIVALQAVYVLCEWLYGLAYHGAKDVFLLLPVGQVLVDTLLGLFANTLIVFLYEDLRRQSPARAEV